MSYSSPLAKYLPIIGDDNWQDHVDVTIDGEFKSRGYRPRDLQRHPFGSFAAPFDNSMRIPESEWDERIEEEDRTKSSLVDIADQAGLKVLDQNGTNYCWINATVHCVELMRLVQGQPLVKLSPASIGAKIKNYRNEGGWGIEGLEYLIQHGVAPVNTPEGASCWPANAINPSFDNTKSRELRKLYMPQDWLEIPARDFGAIASLVLQKIPVSCGYAWWSHQVTCVKLVKMPNGDYGMVIDNSWGTSYGTNGRAILTRSKATPDDLAVACLSILAV